MLMPLCASSLFSMYPIRPFAGSRARKQDRRLEPRESNELTPARVMKPPSSAPAVPAAASGRHCRRISARAWLAPHRPRPRRWSVGTARRADKTRSRSERPSRCASARSRRTRRRGPISLSERSAARGAARKRRPVLALFFGAFVTRSVPSRGDRDERARARGTQPGPAARRGASPRRAAARRAARSSPCGPRTGRCVCRGAASSCRAV